MPGFIGEDQVRRIKETVDLVQLMGEYTALKKAGGNFTGCCPFHQERTPSMYVYAGQGTYHCFGCGAHGDVITLVRDKERLEFTDAIELLARRAGIEIHYEKGGERMPKGERERLAEAMEMATRFYETLLWERSEGAEAREYLASRGLSQAVCKRFRLGWAPGSGMLAEEARRRGVDIGVLRQVDLVVERGGRWTDRFFERVTFPICDRFGNPIAFSARLLPAAERAAKEKGVGVGKYVNNTETPLYHKGNVIFNLHRARTAARDKNRLIVMEGPTDVMAGDDAGYAECVAVMGTALTAEHAKQLGAIAGPDGRLVLLFDGDRAGRTNSLKAVRTCLAVGVTCWVAVVPDELDPAELLKEETGAGGKEAFEKVLASARQDLDHLLRAEAPRPYELENRELLQVADEIIKALRPLPDVELRRLYLRDAAAWLNLDIARLEARLRSVPAAAAVAAAATGEAPMPDLDPAQAAVLHLLVRLPALRPVAFDDLGVEPSDFPPAWRALVDRLANDPDCDAASLAATAGGEGGQPALASQLFAWLNADALGGLTPIAADSAPELLRHSVASLRLSRLGDEAHRLKLAVAEAEKRRDFAEVGRLGAELVGLERRIKELREAGAAASG